MWFPVSHIVSKYFKNNHLTSYDFLCSISSSFEVRALNIHVYVSRRVIKKYVDFCHNFFSRRHIIICTFANVFPYITLTTKLTFNFAWIHLITWYHFFQCVWIQYLRFSISGSLYYFHIVNQCKQYRPTGCTEGKHIN